MSEKEQTEAVKLLAEWLKTWRAAVGIDAVPTTAEIEALAQKTEKFLNLPLVVSDIVPPESHGQRQS